MRENLETIKRIENYLLNKISVEDKAIFENEMRTDDQFRQQVETQELVMKAIKRSYLKADIKKVSANQGFNFGGKSIGFIIVIAFAIISLLTYLLIFKSDNLSIKQEVAPDGYHFNGLKTWVTPDIQHFTFDAEEGATIEGKNGILIIVPSNAFVNEQDEKVYGQIDFQLIEALTLDQMILYNLTTTSNEKTLGTGGMFYTNATLKGKPLKINPGRPLYIEVPTQSKKKGMMAYQGEVTDEGNMNWKDPVPLQKYLVQVDFDHLDFLPEGFEKRVRLEDKNSEFYILDKDRIDSLYYTLEYDPSKIISLEFPPLIEEIGRRSSTLSIRTSAPPLIPLHDEIYMQDEVTYDLYQADSILESLSLCGIDPLTIKTIRTREFESSFIATKAFESRIKALHQLRNGETFVQLYIQHIRKDMWEIDQMVAESLTGEERKIFEDFASQKLTNTYKTGIYQERLYEYYKEKKAAYRKSIRELNLKIIQNDTKKLEQLNREINELNSKLNQNTYNQSNNETLNNLVNSLPVPNAATSNVYATLWYDLGWTNIDEYLKLLDDENKEVPIIASQNYTEVKIYQWLNVIRTLTPIKVKDNKGKALFPSQGSEGANQMEATYAIAISKEKKQLKWASVHYNPYLKDSLAMELTSIELDELKIKLKSFDQGTLPLIGSLKTTEEEINERIERRKLSRELNELNKTNLTNEQIAIDQAISAKRKERLKEAFRVKRRSRFLSELILISFPCFKDRSLARVSEEGDQIQ